MYIRKDVEVADLHLKSEGESMIVEGYASTFGNKDAVNDVMEKGVFGKMNPKKIKFLWQHDVTMPIGVIKEIAEDSKGVYMKAKFSNTQLGNDAYTLADDGAVDAFSVGFSINPKGFRYDEKSGVRYISKAKLMEVSAVTFPANDKARIVSVKGLGEHGFKSKREFEDCLSAMGFSQNESLIITSKAYPTLLEHWESGSKLDNQGELDLKELQGSIDNLLKQFTGN